jgi:amidophosphoribosyltransferase
MFNINLRKGGKVLSLRESCGVFGTYSERDDAFPYLYWGMLAQNHRGHQSHGFATFDGEISCNTGLGLIPPLEESNLARGLSGRVGIASVRYATSGSSDTESLQRDAMPIVVSDGVRSIAVSFNGNIVNIRSLQRRVGAPSNYSDSHALSLLMLQRLGETGSIAEAVRSCMRGIDGSFSITGVTDEGTLFAFKDPVGVKPLCYGCNGDVHAFSSESVGLDINGLELQHELRPGELITVNDGEFCKEQVARCNRKAFCAFEFAYFARPDSKFNGKYVYQARRDFGVALARNFREEALGCNVVVSLPETANDAAYGFHQESGLDWDMATRRHRYMTQRAFIVNSGSREDLLARKMNILPDRIGGKAIAVVDDSIVRGDTTKMNVRRFRAAGTREVHLFITFPRITGPCFYGIDMSTYKELIGASLDPEGIAEELDADSVNYLSIEDFVKATGLRRDELCLGCVTGEYPTPRARDLSLEMRSRLEEGIVEEGRIYEQTIGEHQQRVR